MFYLICLIVGEVLQVPRQQEEVPLKRSPVVVNKTNKKIKTLKPVESKNLEISEVPSDAFTEVIFETQPNCNNTICMALEECYEELQVAVPVGTEATDTLNGPQTPDHDYYRTPQTVPDFTEDHEEYTDVETIWIKSEDKDNINSSITNYVLDTDSVTDHTVSILRCYLELLFY